MAPIERWYKKWDALEDSGDEAKKPSYLPPQRTLKHLPADIAASVQEEQDPGKREALLALNSFIVELHNPPQPTPARQQRLLPFLSHSLKGLEEGGELERLLWQVHAVLHHPKVSHRKLEESAGACALLRDVDPIDPRLISTILRSTNERLQEFSASSLARTAWSAAVLVNSPVKSEASELLEKTLQRAEDLMTHFVAEDISLLAVACATGSPSCAPQLLRKLNAWGLEGFEQKEPSWSNPDLEPDCGVGHGEARETCLNSAVGQTEDPIKLGPQREAAPGAVEMLAKPESMTFTPVD